jgi:putative transposase
MHKSHNLRIGRISERGQTYHINFCVENRAPLFLDLWFAREVVLSMRGCDAREITQTLAFVVMPDHVHWLFELKTGTVGAAVSRAKANSSRAINKRRNAIGSVWQKDYYDHALRSEESVHDVARYIVANPLRAGLVKSVRDYSHWYAVYL